MTEKKFDEKFADENPDKVGWYEISERGDELSIEFVKRHKDRLKWKYLLYSKVKFNKEFVESFPERFDDDVWKMISSLNELDIQFIEDYENKFDWYTLSSRICIKNVREDMIERHIDELDLKENCSLLTSVSEEFIERHIDKIEDWDSISRNENLSEEFIDRHSDKVNWDNVLANECVSEEFIERHIDKVDWDLSWYNIGGRYSSPLSEEFVERHADKLKLSEIDFKNFSDDVIIRFDAMSSVGEVWKNKSVYFDRNVDFLERYIDKVNWWNVSTYANLSEEFVVRHKDKINWQNLFQRDDLSFLTEEFIEQYANKVGWLFISRNIKLSEPFIELHTDEVDWTAVSSKQELSEDFIERHANKINWNTLEPGSMSYEFLDRNADKLRRDKFVLSDDEIIDEDFLIRHIDKFSWTNVFCTRYFSLSDEIKERFMDRVNFNDVPSYEWIAPVKDIISRYPDRIDWNKILFQKEGISFFGKNLDIDFVMEHSDRFDCNLIPYSCYSFELDCHIFEKYSHKFDIPKLFDFYSKDNSGQYLIDDRVKNRRKKLLEAIKNKMDSSKKDWLALTRIVQSI